MAESNNKEKLKKLTSLIEKVTDPKKKDKLQQFMDESAKKKNPPKSEKLKEKLFSEMAIGDINVANL